MVEIRILKRLALLLLALLGCFIGFLGLMMSAGAVLQRVNEEPIFMLLDKGEQTSLPCRVDGSSLIARQLVMYEGPDLEKDNDTPLTDIFALVLYNDGEQEISQAEVKLTAGEELTFFASNIMPGAQVLVLEKNGTPWRECRVTACTGWVSSTEHVPLPPHALDVKEVDMGTLSVTNTTAKDLNSIWLFYKNYIPEGELYVGGITYIQTINSLKAGETVQIKPPHYAAGYSRIIKAEIVE